MLTSTEVGALLRVKPRSVAAISGLNPIRLNSKVIRYRREAVEQWLESLERGNR